MSSSSDTAYSPESIPKTKDWAQMAQNNNGHYGSGPGLQDPDDDIQKSDRAFEDHQAKAANAVVA